MELIAVRTLLNDAQASLDLSKGFHWVVTVGAESCDEIFKVITLANSQDFECEVHGLLLQRSEEAKEWLKGQGIKISCFVAEDTAVKEKLQIRKLPWFTCVDSGTVVYSSGEVPKDLRIASRKRIESRKNDAKNSEDESGENNDVDRLQLMIKQQKNIIQDFKVEMRQMRKIIANKAVEGHKKDQTIHDFKAEMREMRKILAEKAKEVQKLKLIIQDFKAEIREIRKILARKNATVPSLPLEKPVSPTQEISPKNDSQPSTLRSKFRPEFPTNDSPRLKAADLSPYMKSFKKKATIGAVRKLTKLTTKGDDREFWNIEDKEENQDTIKFEDIAANKDLWLMGLLARQESPRQSRLTKILPSLQISSRTKDSSSVLRQLTHGVTPRAKNSSIPLESVRGATKRY
jgi:hypothetical protein